MVNFKLFYKKKIENAKCMAKKLFVFKERTKKNIEKTKFNNEKTEEVRRKSVISPAPNGAALKVEILDHRLDVEYDTCKNLKSNDSEWIGPSSSSINAHTENVKRPQRLLFPEAQFDADDHQEIIVTTAMIMTSKPPNSEKQKKMQTLQEQNEDKQSVSEIDVSATGSFYDADIYDDEEDDLEEDKRAKHVKRRKKKSDVKEMPMGVSSCSMVETVVHPRRPNSRSKQSQLTMQVSQSGSVDNRVRFTDTTADDADDEAVAVSQASMVMPTPLNDGTAHKNDDANDTK